MSNGGAAVTCLFMVCALKDFKAWGFRNHFAAAKWVYGAVKWHSCAKGWFHSCKTPCEMGLWLRKLEISRFGDFAAAKWSYCVAKWHSCAKRWFRSYENFCRGRHGAAKTFHSKVAFSQENITVRAEIPKLLSSVCLALLPAIQGSTGVAPSCYSDRQHSFLPAKERLPGYISGQSPPMPKLVTCWHIILRWKTPHQDLPLFQFECLIFTLLATVSVELLGRLLHVRNCSHCLNLITYNL